VPTGECASLSIPVVIADRNQAEAAAVATTLETQCMTWAVDEVNGGLPLIRHASFSTLEENLTAVQEAERAGA
jgi:predicted transcriptional regulator